MAWAAVGATIFAALIGVFGQVASIVLTRYFDVSESNWSEIKKVAMANAETAAENNRSINSLTTQLSTKAEKGRVLSLETQVARNSRDVSEIAEDTADNSKSIERMKGRLDVSYTLSEDSILLAKLPLDPLTSAAAHGLANQRRRFSVHIGRKLEYTL